MSIHSVIFCILPKAVLGWEELNLGRSEIPRQAAPREFPRYSETRKILKHLGKFPKILRNLGECWKFCLKISKNSRISKARNQCEEKPRSAREEVEHEQ